jgi:hypothetical protein
MGTNESGQSGGGLAQALHLINGATINDKLHRGIVQDLFARNLSERETIEELYVRALTRLPHSQELSHWETLFADAADRGEAAQDLLWTLLNSREFSFNH